MSKTKEITHQNEGLLLIVELKVDRRGDCLLFVGENRFPLDEIVGEHQIELPGGVHDRGVLERENHRLDEGDVGWADENDGRQARLSVAQRRHLAFHGDQCDEDQTIVVEQNGIFGNGQRHARVRNFQPAARMVENGHGEIAKIGVCRQRLKNVLVEDIQMVLMGRFQGVEWVLVRRRLLVEQKSLLLGSQIGIGQGQGIVLRRVRPCRCRVLLDRVVERIVVLVGMATAARGVRGDARRQSCKEQHWHMAPVIIDRFAPSSLINQVAGCCWT